MKAPPLFAVARKDSPVQWDAHQAFHIRHTPHRASIRIAHFDTDELLLERAGTPSPTERRLYLHGSVEVIGTNDTGLPPMHLADGTPVARAWFGSCQQILLIDYLNREVVSLEGSQSTGYAEKAGVPSRFLRKRAQYAYCPGPGRRWVSDGMISLERPTPNIAPELRAHWRDVETACDVWAATTQQVSGWARVPDIPKRERGHNNMPTITLTDARNPSTKQVVWGWGSRVPPDAIDPDYFTQMSREDRLHVAAKGWLPPTTKFSVRVLRLDEVVK